MTDQLRIYDADIVAPGGDFNPAGYHVDRIGAREAGDLVEQHHYLHRRPNVSHAFGLIADTGRVDEIDAYLRSPAARWAPCGTLDALDAERAELENRTTH